MQSCNILWKTTEIFIVIKKANFESFRNLRVFRNVL